ncbi:MAG: shikimate kinase [Tepidisphaeraceae bacterium]
MSIILLGPRGCGKSTVGKRLADKLWISFVSSDDLVTQAARKSIREIFEQDGEDRFRELEVQAVRDVCARADHVIELGGGAVEREENRRAILESAHRRIYLRCAPQELLRRIQSDPATSRDRPPLTTLSAKDEVTTVLMRREPIYQSLMTAELEVTSLSIDDAVVHLTRMM